MLKNILVPLDGSALAECVLPHVIAIATAFDASVILLNVIEQPTASFGQRKIDPLDWYLEKTEASTYLQNVQVRLEAQQLTVKTVLLEGRAIDQIIEMAHAEDGSLLILGSHNANDSNGWSVSNIVQQVVQRTRTSILIIPCSQVTPVSSDLLHYHRLLVPLDGSRRASAALPIATALVQAHSAELVLVHVVNKPEMARYMPLTQEDTDLINRVVERNEEEGNKYLDQIRSHLPANVQTRLLVSDNVAATLQAFSEQEQIDLLILSAHGYSGEAKWPYGSVTNRFISDGTLPLLIIQDLPYEAREAVRDDTTVRQISR